ncbi:hypothetical protein MRX96_007617 [Rhipicephalus microplus]
MIAAVSPSKLSYTDTHNTLKYEEQDIKFEQQAMKNVLNVNVLNPMYSSLIEEYKKKEEGRQLKQDGLLQVPHNDAGSTTTASHNDALSTTLVLSPSVEANEPSDNSTAPYCLDAARNIYAVRAQIIRQICENETIIRNSVAKENRKQHMAKTVRALQDCSEDNLKAYDLHITLEAKNCCSLNQRDARGAIVKKAKGPDVTWVDEENES